MTELKDQLSLLGRKTEYRQNYAPEVLEAFDNKHPGNDYWVRFNCPEFTSLCPITGQPDFAEIRICYIFMFIKLLTKLTEKKKEEAPAAPPAPPAPSKEEVLLTEIRDLLKEK